MAVFVDVHHGFVGVTGVQLCEAMERDLAIQDGEGVRFAHWWLDGERGTLFCLSTAPSRECLLRVHERAGHPPSDVYEICVELDAAAYAGGPAVARSGG
jgi:hypothetical protein